jgi:hypothetical protein
LKSFDDGGGLREEPGAVGDAGRILRCEETEHVVPFAKCECLLHPDTGSR